MFCKKMVDSLLIVFQVVTWKGSQLTELDKDLALKKAQKELFVAIRDWRVKSQ